MPVGTIGYLVEDFQKEKHIVLSYYEALSSASEYEIEEICSEYVSDNCLWQSYHPFKDQIGGLNIARHFWTPFKMSLSRLQRRQDIFFAGRNLLNNKNSIWVVSMGHLMGLFDKDWLLIKANKKMTFLKYACTYTK